MSGYEDIVPKGIGIITTQLELMYQDWIHSHQVFLTCTDWQDQGVFSFRMRVVRTNLTIPL
jgi:hypothetical protein